MSAYIPFELQAEIIKSVRPVKSLLQFRSVSKQWKSLIDSSEFITQHTVNHNQPHHLLVKHHLTYAEKYVSIPDDDSFPHHKFSPVVPPTVDLLSCVFVLDCSNGLVCLYGCSFDYHDLIVFWNPLIRKSVGIGIPFRPNRIVGFGVCPKTSDPKIVMIVKDNAEVFTLSSRVWRSVSMNTRVVRSLRFLYKQMVIDGVIYWLTRVDVTNMIYSFDLTSEEFGELVDLPNNLGERSPGLINISKINESLVLLSFDSGEKSFCDVWMMLKNGVAKPSFTKLFTVKDVMTYSIIGFRKNGQPIIKDHIPCNYEELKVYEPCSEHVNGLGIYGSVFMVSSYTESLLLVNHSERVIWS